MRSLHSGLLPSHLAGVGSMDVPTNARRVMSPSSRGTASRISPLAEMLGIHGEPGSGLARLVTLNKSGPTQSKPQTHKQHMIGKFYITKFASSDYKTDRGEQRTSTKVWLSDADPNPVTRLSTELVWSIQPEVLPDLGDTKALRGAQVEVAIKQVTAAKNGLPSVVCEFISFVGKAPMAKAA